MSHRGPRGLLLAAVLVAHVGLVVSIIHLTRMAPGAKQVPTARTVTWLRLLNDDRPAPRPPEHAGVRPGKSDDARRGPSPTPPIARTVAPAGRTPDMASPDARAAVGVTPEPITWPEVPSSPGVAEVPHRSASSPLDLRYWSTTPYRWGDKDVVKYGLMPTSQHRSTLPATLADDYLSQAMQAHLDRHDASFDFGVQLRKGTMPVEDAAVRWDETESPFVTVARLHIPRQTFRTPERDALGETLSFSPGHAKPAHTPLGGINRARVAIYQQLSAFRHQRDQRANIA